MKKTTLRALPSFALALGLLVLATDTQGAARWTNSTSGLWRQTNNWLSGTLPSLGAGTTYITNAGTKTVTIDAATPLTNLVINQLHVAGRGAGTNSLELVDLGASNPLIISNNSFNVGGGGRLHITNSSLVVTGRLIGFNVYAGSATLDSGLIFVREEPPSSNVTVTTRIGRTNVASFTMNGGVFESSKLQIGETPNPALGLSHGTLRLRGGQVKVYSELTIGESASCTGLVEITGGELIVPNYDTNITRIGDQGFGTMIVSNASAFLNNVSVGRHDGAVGLLHVQSNALVGCSDDMSIGRFSGATGTVVVTGGRLVVTNDAIWVGREGRGQLIISNGVVETESLHVAIVPTNTANGNLSLAGGTLLVSSNFCLGDAQLSVGQVRMTSGDFVVGNDLMNAYSSIPNGTMTIDGGTFTTDLLYLTNTVGRIAFHGGMLRTRNTIVSNGVAFVVGDGTNSATLHLVGGTHFFANGLVISSNATLSGCGTIIGTVVNHGTIATNCLTMPRISKSTFTNSSFAITFDSVAGVSYTLEYKDHLVDASWTPLPPPVTGSGGPLTITDTSASVPTRFYRLRAE